jgi:Spy/CpxP family protein refolding chaperone
MKILKIVVSLLALTAVPFVQAQAGKAPSGESRKGDSRGGSIDAQIDRIDAAVTLTADQKAKIRAILTKVQEKVQALPQEDRRTQGMELRRGANQEIRALLTPEQQKKFQTMPGDRGAEKGKRKKDKQ